MLHAEINFKIGRKKYRFNVVSNLADLGLSIDAALFNWSERTSYFTEQSFIDYVKSKDINIICMSKAEFESKESANGNKKDNRAMAK